MSEPEVLLDPKEVTPATPATPEVTAQPDSSEPDATVKLKELETKLQDMESKAKRYKEQLVGREKQLEELKLKTLIAKEPEETTTVEKPVIDEVKEVPKETRREDIEHIVYINKAMMKDEFGEDKTVPWNKEVAAKVEEVLNKMDPTGRTKKYKEAWTSAYKIYKGEISESLIRQREEQIREEFQKKEQAKAAAHVETVTTPTPLKTGPTLDDVISGKVKMTAKEMALAFPEVRAQATKKWLKDNGIE